MFVPQRGQLLQFSFSQSLLKDSSTAFWMTLFPKRCSINFFPSAVADRYSSLRFRNSSAAQDTRRSEMHSWSLRNEMMGPVHRSLEHIADITCSYFADG